jgi:hypothetical protein
VALAGADGAEAEIRHAFDARRSSTLQPPFGSLKLGICTRLFHASPRYAAGRRQGARDAAGDGANVRPSG